MDTRPPGIYVSEEIYPAPPAAGGIELITFEQVLPGGVVESVVMTAHDAAIAAVQLMQLTTVIGLVPWDQVAAIAQLPQANPAAVPSTAVPLL